MIADVNVLVREQLDFIKPNITVCVQSMGTWHSEGRDLCPECWGINTIPANNRWTPDVSQEMPSKMQGSQRIRSSKLGFGPSSAIHVLHISP